MGKEKVAVAMSGGVDSGVAAALLVEKGFKVLGFHLHLWAEEFDEEFLKKLGGRWENKCCSTESLEAARKTAGKLGIPFYVLDYAQDFKKIVVDYFLDEYKKGRTPNPCVVCNRFIRFGKLLEYIRGLGCEYLATGHYVRKFKAKSSKLKATYHLLQGVDKKKDQSYFLWTLTQDKLGHLLFPIGEFYKEKVRQIAREKRLPVASRPESMEVCFTPEQDYRAFIRRQIPEAIVPGEVVNTKGQVIGKHFGLPLYTIGQRKGFRIEVGSEKLEVRGVPLYVVGIDVKKNQLVVGRGEESERREFMVGEVNWINPNVKCQMSNVKCHVKIRHQGEMLKAKLKIKNEKVKIELEEAVRGVTPGQSAVFYKKLLDAGCLPASSREASRAGQLSDFEVLGGGVIEK
jgi:tRNA-specific 2-thiouridylase